MANRSYLYSLSNRPMTFADRPEAISGLSEWAYAVPFCFRVLMSGDPQLCASFVSDGFDDEPVGKKTPIHAISADFELGFARLKRFFTVLQELAHGVPALVAAMHEAVEFLEAHRNRYTLLETIEIDLMSAEGGPALRARVQAEVEMCRQVGAAIDALPADLTDAVARLSDASTQRAEGPLAAFFGLRLDERFDDVRGGTEHPLGLGGWSEVLYYELWNRADFAAHQPKPGELDAAQRKLRRDRVVTVIVLTVLCAFLIRSWLAAH